MDNSDKEPGTHGNAGVAGTNISLPRQKRVLLVEDELHDEVKFLEMVSELGCHVQVASNLDDGLRCGRQTDYDAIIVDLDLNGNFENDGLLLVKMLRAEGIKCPISILTREDSVACRMAAYEAGANAYDVKWPGRDDLVERLQNLMGDEEV